MESTSTKGKEYVYRSKLRTNFQEDQNLTGGGSQHQGKKEGLIRVVHGNKRDY